MTIWLRFIVVATVCSTACRAQSSLYGEEINTCPVTAGFLQDSTSDVAYVADTLAPTYYEERKRVRSEIECTIVCKRDADCVTAFYDGTKQKCYLARESIHSMGKEVTQRASGSGFSKHMVIGRPRSVQPSANIFDTSSECSSTTCLDGAYACRKDCGNNVGICTGKLSECDEIPVSNVKHYYYANYGDGTDDGILLTKTYNKKYSHTAIRVKFRATIRAAYNCGGCCSRWYFTFDGVECADPGAIDIVWYTGAARDYYRPARIDGLCEGLPAGDVVIRLRAGACSGYGVYDTQTGWGTNVGASLTFEENDIRHAFENDLQTYGGNVNGAACTFPFTYNGQSHSQCTEVNHIQLWCATTSNYDVDGKWGNCPGTCPHHSRFNIKQFAWGTTEHSDEGHLFAYYYYKRAADTALQVLFKANVYKQQFGYLMYYIRIDGNDCTSPGVMSGVWSNKDSSVTDGSHDGTGAVVGICDNIGAGRHSIDIYLTRSETDQNGDTGWNSWSRIVVEEIRYNSDVQAVITPDGSVQRLPEFNIKHWFWSKINDGTDDGHIVAVDEHYTKKSSQSMLEVYFHGTLRQVEAADNSRGCSQWYLTFGGSDSSECSSPGPLAGTIYQRIIHNLTPDIHDNAHGSTTIGGMCDLPAGTYNIRLYVRTCPGYSYNQAYTGWNTGSRLIVKEVFLSTD